MNILHEYLMNVSKDLCKQYRPHNYKKHVYGRRDRQHCNDTACIFPAQTTTHCQTWASLEQFAHQCAIRNNAPIMYSF